MCAIFAGNDIMIEIKRKYVFHIPLEKFIDGKLVEIEIEEILDELIEKLGDSFYMTRVKSCYKSRFFDELLITVFSQSQLEEIFKEWFIRNNTILMQEAFAFEVDGKMIIEKLG